MTQPIRRSQFITTYGPGAILEGPDGPRLIPTLGDSRVFDGRRATDFEITDQRLSQALLNSNGILRLPSNAEVNEPDFRYIYRDLPLPFVVSLRTAWNPVPQDQQRHSLLPTVPFHTGSGEAWRRARRDSIRFVRACASGHLDDVDWLRSIPHRGDSCTPAYLLWHGGGGALRQIEIVCPDCQGQLNLGIAYSRDWRCSGRLPEQGSFRPGGCAEPSKIIQRGAANLRMAELRTALTIPPRYTRLHRLLEMSVVQSALVAAPPGSRQDLLQALRNLVASGLLMQPVVDEIETYSEPAILSVVRDTLSGGTASNERELRIEEFEGFADGSEGWGPISAFAHSRFSPAIRGHPAERANPCHLFGAQTSRNAGQPASGRDGADGIQKAWPAESPRRSGLLLMDSVSGIREWSFSARVSLLTSLLQFPRRNPCMR